MDRPLRGLSLETASLYGMPHIGSEYTGPGVDKYTHSDYLPCIVCGMPASNIHHEPPRGKSRARDPETGKTVKGAFLLETPKGSWLLRPALIALCGTGTKGCHGARHSGALSIRWEWDSDEDKWWDGAFLSEGREPNGQWLYEFGHYVFADVTGEWSYYGGDEWRHSWTGRSVFGTSCG